MTGIIYGWTFFNNRIHGRMEEHANRPDLNGHECYTSAVVSIGMVNGDRIAVTKSGSKYRLID
jgi:hypothetical protein